MITLQECSEGVKIPRRYGVSIHASSTDEETDGRRHAVDGEFEGGPPEDEHAEVEPFGMSEADSTVAADPDDEVQGAEEHGGHAPTVASPRA